MRLFQVALDTPLDSPSSATLSVHGLRAVDRKSLALSWVRDEHRNRKSQKSLRFRCAKPIDLALQDSKHACLTASWTTKVS